MPSAADRASPTPARPRDPPPSRRRRRAEHRVQAAGHGGRVHRRLRRRTLPVRARPRRSGRASSRAAAIDPADSSARGCSRPGRTRRRARRRPGVPRHARTAVVEGSPPTSASRSPTRRHGCVGTLCGIDHRSVPVTAATLARAAGARPRLAAHLRPTDADGVVIRRTPDGWQVAGPGDPAATTRAAT